MKSQSTVFTILKPFLIVLSYWLLLEAAFVCLLTIITSSLLMNERNNTSNIGQSVDDISRHYTLLSYGLAALFFFALYHYGSLALSSSTKKQNIKKSFWHSGASFWKESLLGISHSVVFITIVLTPLLLSRQIEFHGISILSQTWSPLFLIFVQNCLSLLIIVFCEEYIFRQKVLIAFIKYLPTALSLLLSSLLYVFIKYVQFNPPWEECVSLFFLSSLSSLFFLRTRNIFLSIAFLASFYGILHFICGFTLWMRQDQSLFLFTYSPSSFYLLTGGGKGPLSGLSFLACLFLFLCTEYYLSRKIEDSP